MKFSKKLAAKIPGAVASISMLFFTVFWTYWGINEMYHEGWWGAWYHRLPYLAPVALTLFPTLAAFRWPLVGGSLLAAVGIFALFFFSSDVAYIGLAIAFVGALFIADGILKRRKIPQETNISPRWWRKNLHYILAVGLPLLVILIVSFQMLPVVLTRMDDGNRGAQLIEGNGVSLIWAPEGPGWNWKQSWGGYPSWQSIALYGLAPVGLDEKSDYGKSETGDGKTVYAAAEEMAQTNLCRYLNSDGTRLMDEAQNIWRMPTTDELVRSLGRHGKSAGCIWQGELGKQVTCKTSPDKESPLWSTDQSAIYYWSADSYNEERAYFVAYNGTVNTSGKLGGNPRHGYRCVKEQ